MAAKKFGVIGGMGPLATSRFVDLFLSAYIQRVRPSGDQDFPDMSVFYDCSNQDRTSALATDRDYLRQRIQTRIDELRATGHSVIAVPCVTAHAVIDFEGHPDVLIDFRQVLLKSEDIPASSKIGILATTGAIQSGVLHPLSERFDLIYPDEELQKNLMNLIYANDGLKSGTKNDTGAEVTMQSIVDSAFADVDYVMLGCTELEAFCSASIPDIPLIKPMEIMANRAIDLLLGDEKAT